MIISIMNFMFLIATALIHSYFYLKSVSPAALEKKIGNLAFPKCTSYRRTSAIFTYLQLVGYIIYFFYPLPIPIPRTFFWGWGISLVIALFTLVLALLFLVTGDKDLGNETMSVLKEHKLNSQGIYAKIRHPQTIGRILLTWFAAFALNSPFLLLYSITWIICFTIMCVKEEKDLVIRYGGEFLEYKKHTGFYIPKIKIK